MGWLQRSVSILECMHVTSDTLLRVVSGRQAALHCWQPPWLNVTSVH
jgi:hypothetical protein